MAYAAYLVRPADRIIIGMYYTTPRTRNSEIFLGWPRYTLSLTGIGDLHPIKYNLQGNCLCRSCRHRLLWHTQENINLGVRVRHTICESSKAFWKLFREADRTLIGIFFLSHILVLVGPPDAGSGCTQLQPTIWLPTIKMLCVATYAQGLRKNLKTARRSSFYFVQLVVN
jgi:hypothetical protein